MFKLNEFIASLQCAWIKRSFMSVTDNWRYKLCEISNNNALLVVPDTITRNTVGVVLNNIVVSFCRFKEKFATLDNNYMTVPFYCNNSFGYGRGLEHKLDEQFFGTTNNLGIRNAIIGTTWRDITINGTIMNKPQMEMHLGIDLSHIKYGNICNAYRCALNKYNKIGAPSIELATFITTFKKGSKRFRNVFEKAKEKDELPQSQQVNTFHRLIDCMQPAPARLRSLFCSWNKNCVSSRINMFKFKYFL